MRRENKKGSLEIVEVNKDCLKGGKCARRCGGAIGRTRSGGERNVTGSTNNVDDGCSCDG